MLESLIITVVVAIIAWVLVDRFCPDATLSFIFKLVIFALVFIKVVMPLLGVHF